MDEINSGVYAFEAHLLGDAVKRVPTDNAKGEEYLTDVVAILRAEGHHVASVTLEDPDEVLGVNDRAQLARARQIFNARLLGTWMGAGVTIVDPATTWIDTGVSLARDVEIGPGTQLEGRTTVAAGARVGPGAAAARHHRGRGRQRHPVRLPGGRHRRGRGRGAVRLPSSGQQGRCRWLRSGYERTRNRRWRADDRQRTGSRPAGSGRPGS